MILLSYLCHINVKFSLVKFSQISVKFKLAFSLKLALSLVKLALSFF